MTFTSRTIDASKGYSCDDYHQLIASRVTEHAEKLGRDIDYIEIGTLTGNSAAAVLETGKINRAVLIDDFSLVWYGQKQSKQKVEERLKEHAGKFEIVEGDSRQVTRTVQGTFDIGFVDGDHEEASCRADMANMFPLLKPDGIMFIHDVGNESFTYLMPVVARFAQQNGLTMELHEVFEGLAELRRK